MKRLSTVLFTSLLIYFLCSGTRSGYAGEDRGVTDDTIKIGLIADMTGVAAELCIPCANGVRTYFRHINDQGGINGRKVKIILEDDHYTIPGALAAFKKLIFKDKIFSTVILSTGAIVALMKQIEEQKVPVMTISLAEKLTTPVRRYIFTPSASYEDGLKVIVDYIMKDLKAKNPRIAMVYAEAELTKSGLQPTEKYLANYNLKLSSKTVINMGEIDATSQVLVLKKENPDYIILHTVAAGPVAFFRAANRYGLSGSKVIGGCYVGEEIVIRGSGDAMKDALVVSSFGYWGDNTPGMAELRKITTKYRPEIKQETRTYTQCWVAAMIFTEGLKRAGRNLNTETLVEAYETFKNFSTGEISGAINYSKNNHKGGMGIKLYKVDVKNQTFIPITEYREPAFKD